MELEYGGRRYAVAAGDLVIGSGPDATLVLVAPEVRARHALVRLLAPGMAVVVPAEPGAEILVNGARLGSDPTPLRHGDRLRIGGLEVVVHDPGRAVTPPAGSESEYRLGETIVGLKAVRRPPPMPEAVPAPPAEPLATLLVKRGQRKGERLPVRTPVTNVGRGEYNDIVLPDASISTNHAKLQLKEGIWVLTDLGSTNGSRVNGKVLQGETPLAAGVEVAFGEVTLLFEPRERGVTPRTPTAVVPELRGAAGAEASTTRARILVLAGLGVLLLVAYLLLR